MGAGKEATGGKMTTATWRCNHRSRGPLSNNISVLFCDVLPPSSTPQQNVEAAVLITPHTRVQPVQFEGYVVVVHYHVSPPRAGDVVAGALS